jgi:hypothetical protein
MVLNNYNLLAKSMVQQSEEIVPDPGSLIESLRDFGYTLPTALADLVDNSIAAGAKKISIEVDSGAQPFIAVCDDGCGMDLKRLLEAMKFGGFGPNYTRKQSDLGRFGLGLKTASLSQGQTVTVITRVNGDNPVVRKWDIPHISKTGRWSLLKDLSPESKLFHKIIEKQKSGTAVIIEQLDRTTFLRVAPSDLDQHVGHVLDAVREHLAMVFHRFIDAGIELRLGQTRLQAWDPFLRCKSTQLSQEQLHCGKFQIGVTPYILPHRSKLSEDEHQQASGPLGWNAHQGFYVYRCDRLIVPGTWLNLALKKEEHFKLARIVLDLPNTVDGDWHLNVMKSHVAAPAFLRDDLKRIAADVRRQASHVYRHRGERELPQKAVPERFVWTRQNVRGGVRFCVDRSHPVIRTLLHSGCDHEELLDTVLKLVESTIPIASMLQEPSKTLDGVEESESSGTIAAYAELMVHAEQFMIRTGTSPQAAREKILSAEPFVRFREAILDHLSAGE